MPNYATTRLTITGPLDELERFQRECIRIPVDDETDEPTLDLDALVPMPPEILATLDGSSEETRQVARAATGYDSWYEWSITHWGTKWNTSNFEGTTFGSIYDCAFDTAWGCPQPALAALAARYPSLSGSVVSSEEGNDWCIMGDFRNGLYTSASADFDPQVHLLVHGGHYRSSFSLASVRALIESLADPEPCADEVHDRPVDQRVRAVIATLDRLMPGGVSRRFAFERTALDVTQLLDGGNSAHDIRERALGWCDESEADALWLLSNDRARTALDRQLLVEAAACLRAEVIAGWADADASAGYRCWIEERVVSNYDEDDLRSWAALAMYRPGAVIDMGDAETLEQSFLAYADQLRIDMLNHLSCINVERTKASVTSSKAA